jgi:hypothetical protein
MAHNPALMDAKWSQDQQNLILCVSEEIDRTLPVLWIEIYHFKALFMVCGSLHYLK